MIDWKQVEATIVRIRREQWLNITLRDTGTENISEAAEVLAHIVEMVDKNSEFSLEVILDALLIDGLITFNPTKLLEA